MSRCHKPPDSHPPDHQGVAADAFWRFALACWSVEPARDLLLQWQDHRGVDVIPILFACWFPGRLPMEQWNRLLAVSRRWNRDVTRRIRGLRRRVPGTLWPEGYRACRALEQTSERIEAAWLSRVIDTRSRDRAAGPDIERRLERLFPVLPPTEIRQLTAFISVLRPWARRRARSGGSRLDRA